MTSITNESASGRAHVIVSESPVRAPLAADIAWSRHDAPAIGGIPIGNVAQIQRVPDSVVDFLGQPMNRREGRDI
jgi:hypothetical protein